MTYQPPQDPYPQYAHGQQSIPPQPAQHMQVPMPVGPGGRVAGRFGPGQKASLIIGGTVLTLLLCCGGIGALGAIGDDKPERPSTAVGEAGAEPSTTAPAVGGATVSVPSSSPAAPATTAPATTAAKPPAVQKRTVTETRKIPYGEKRVKDPSLPKGTTKVRTKGVNGVRTLTYEVTLTNGVQTGKRLLTDQVTRAPVTRVVAVGTKQTRKCDPNYGGCVPIASDVDCSGGSGNGPAYVSGPVTVIGSDIYDLDRDNDGVGCD